VDTTAVEKFELLVTKLEKVQKSLGADSTEATGNFAPVLTEALRQTSCFVPVPFRGIF